MPIRRLPLLLLVTLTLPMVAFAVPARAQEAPADQPAADAPAAAEAPAEEPPAIVIPDLTPHVQLLLAQMGVAEADQKLAEAGSFLGQADAVVAAAQAEHDASQARVDSLRRSVSKLAVQAYVDGGDAGIKDAADPTSAVPDGLNTVMFGSVQKSLVGQLVAARQDLETKQAALDAATANRMAAAQAQAEAQAAADRARAGYDAAASNRAAAMSPSVMGAPVMTAEEMAGWYQQQPQGGWAGSVDLPTMVQLYLDEGAAEGVRGDIAFAQAMVETGGFTSRLAGLNNFAGIGACDSCEDGWHFSSAQEGVRVQMQLLHAYAEPATLGFGNAVLVASFNTLGVKGCCDTWWKLTGVWATDPNYGLKIMQIYDSMLSWASAARGLPTG